MPAVAAALAAEEEDVLRIAHGDRKGDQARFELQQRGHTCWIRAAWGHSVLGRPALLAWERVD